MVHTSLKLNLPRILLVGSSLKGGGAENRLRRVVENLFGGNVAVATFKREGLESLRGDMLTTHLGWTGTLSHPSMVMRLRQFLKRHTFDAVLAFGVYPNVVLWAAVQGLQRRPAIILTEIIAPRQESLQIRGAFRRVMIERVRRLTYPRADLFAANSEDGLLEAVQYYGVNPRNARRIPNVFDQRQLEALATSGGAAAAPIDGVPSICIISRFDRRKRIDTLLAAAAGISRHLPWKIDVIGDGEQRLALEAQARTLGIVNRIHFHGWLSNPFPILSTARLSVSCSEYEGFSNSVLESLALGTPVAMSLCSTDARQICEMGAALGFPVGDHVALRAQIERVLSDAELARQMRLRGVEYAQRHALPRAIKEYESLVFDAIERQSKGT